MRPWTLQDALDMFGRRGWFRRTVARLRHARHVRVAKRLAEKSTRRHLKLVGRG